MYKVKKTNSLLVVCLVALLTFTGTARAQDCLTELSESSPPQETDLILCSEFSGIATAYDFEKKSALVVSYHLTRENLKLNVKREKSFKVNTKVPNSFRTYSSWYKHSGYDRGHLAPAADFRLSKNAEVESFKTTNVLPQVPGFNRGVWKSLEVRVRKHVKLVGDVTVITGPVYTNTETKTVRGILVPWGFFKVIVQHNPTQTLSFIIPNKRAKKNYKMSDFVVSLGEVQAATGIDFLYKYPKTTQTRLESKIGTKTNWPVILR